MWASAPTLTSECVPFNAPAGSVGLRADVGIGPYIRVGARTVYQTFDLSKCIRGGRQPALGFILA